MRFSARLLIAIAQFSLIPVASRACSMCMLADPKTAGTYLSMTLFMSILPLGMLAGLGYWLWRRYSPSQSSRSAALRVELSSSVPASSAFEHHRA